MAAVRTREEGTILAAWPLVLALAHTGLDPLARQVPVCRKPNITNEEIPHSRPPDLPTLRPLHLCSIQEPLRPTGGRHRRQECPYRVGLYPQMRKLNHRCGFSGHLHSQKLLLHPQSVLARYRSHPVCRWTLTYPYLR